MKSRLYKRKYSDSNKIYIVENKTCHGRVTLLCTHFPYERLSMRDFDLMQDYKPITTEDS